ncbi:hypothetical protein QVD17_25207 [Tagetes erecta]|uniref:Protein BZR1 homolog n=1 Tax=Tagetes erecta TaxID=13708 RepID=A0AAD8NV99_TARER|nr:hypothetical protein QVD17_25207 [Tagetes erecta]
MEMMQEVGGGGGSSSPAAEGGGGRRKPSWREKENNRRRERRRRAIAANIYNGLRAQGNYDLPKHCDNNEVLKALCKEAGWIVLPDGTTFRKGSRPPLPIIETGATASTTTTPCSSQRPSPMTSYQCSPSSSSFPSPSLSPSTLDMSNLNMNSSPYAYFQNVVPSSLPPLRISNSAPVTPPLSSPTSKFPKPNNFSWETFAKESISSFNLPFLASSAPTSPTKYQRFTPATIPECDESDCSTIDSCKWVRFKNFEPMLTNPNSPTFNLVKPVAPMVATKAAGSDKGKGMEFEFENGGVKAWEGERIHDVGLDDLELTLGSGNGKM